MSSPFLSVIVPSRGDPTHLAALLEALAAQTYERARFEAILALDGVKLPPGAAGIAQEVAARVVELEARGGPGAARNRGAALAKGEFLAFTEDDVIPDPDWLARAAARLQTDAGIDVLEGATVKPDQRTADLKPGDPPLYLPTNLFVRRSLFARLGGYDEAYYDPRTGVYFREDSDFGFTLEESGARIEREPGARVVHPREHLRYADPLRWARRYQMDARLAKRHPRHFRERIEVHRLGPYRLRRPIPRASATCVVALAGAGGAAAFGATDAAIALVVVAGLAFLPVWAKWGFSVRRLPVLLLVPFVMVAALARGRWAASGAHAGRRGSEPG